MHSINVEKLLENVRNAETEDLLDRVTFYRAGMDAEAISMIESELRARDVTPEQIEQHSQQYGEVLLDEQGLALRCYACERPAVARCSDWHRLWGKIPLWQVQRPCCRDHKAH